MAFTHDERSKKKLSSDRPTLKTKAELARNGLMVGVLAHEPEHCMDSTNIESRAQSARMGMGCPHKKSEPVRPQGWVEYFKSMLPASTKK